MRFALARVPHAQPVDVTASVLAQADAVLARWRDHLEAWGRYPSRPIPPGWRTATVAALDDNLDVSAVVTMLQALEDVEDIEPGVKFEAFRLSGSSPGRGLGAHSAGAGGDPPGRKPRRRVPDAPPLNRPRAGGRR